MSKLMNFINDEDGAVTIDWVALTAGVVILGIALVALLRAPLEDLISEISATLDGTGTPST